MKGIEALGHNGKSFTCSAIATYMLMADDEPGADVMLMGPTRSQTTVVFDEVWNTISSAEKLKACINPKVGTLVLEYPAKNGKLFGMSSDGWSKLGRPPHCAIMDEFAFWSDYTPYEAVKHGTGSRRQPLIMYVSTSGTDRTTPGFAVWQFAHAILNSASTDISFFPLIYAAKGDEPIDSVEALKRANPSLGHALQWEEMEIFYDRAQTSKIEELSLRQWHRNEWVSSINQFLNLDAWAACSLAEFPDLLGMPMYLAADMATTTDLCSVVGIVPHQRKFYVIHHSFCCRAGVERTEKHNFVKYDLFEQEGTLTVHDGNCIDFEDVRQYIRKLATEYDVKALAFDPSHNASDTMLMMQAEGYPVKQFRQGPVYFNQPMRRLNELVLDQKLVHRGDSLINWEAQNLESKTDGFDRLSPQKPNDESKIDVMIALCMSLSETLQGEAVPEDQEGIIFW